MACSFPLHDRVTWVCLFWCCLRVPAACRRASADDISRAIDGLAVPVTSLSAAVQADLEGQEEGIFVFVHTVESTGMVFPACVWKVCLGGYAV